MQRLVELVQSGETSLPRVVAHIAEARDADVLSDGHDFIWLGERVFAYPVPMAAQRRALFNSILRSACTPDTDSVVELGAGDGLNLVAFWLAAGPRRARYMAFEIASTGRLCTELLGRLEPEMRVSAHEFDYCAPNYEDLPSGQRHMLVFTSGSVEQISELPKRVITDLLDKADTVTGVHFEPVGWQLLGDDDALAATHKERCTSLGYNENLWSLLNKLRRRRRIEIDRTIPHIFGKLKHPSTLIQWHKRP